MNQRTPLLTVVLAVALGLAALLAIGIASFAHAATLTDAIQCPDATRCPGVTGWLMKYNLKHPDGTVGYTQILVRPTDAIGQSTVACTAQDKRCEGTKTAQVLVDPGTAPCVIGEPCATRPCSAAAPCANARWAKKISDPGTKKVDVHATSLEDAQAYADKVIGAKEADWVKRKPAKNGATNR